MWPSCTRLPLLCHRAALHHWSRRHVASPYYDRAARRRYCVRNSQKQHQQTPPTAVDASSTEGTGSVSKSSQAANTSTLKPAASSNVQSTVEASGGDAPGRTTATASATTTEETTTGADKGEKEGSSSSTIPDVPSQSLGLFEEQDARDPNMWKKYAWKYIGALVLFLGAYETLHWYVDKVEEENKLRHDKNNEQTTTNGTSSTEEQNADQNEMPFLMAGTSPSVVSTAANTSSVATPASLIPLQQQTQDHQDSDSVDEYWAQMVAHATQSTSIASSELDELYAYKRELEAQLQTAGAGISAELKEELEAVNEEIEIFERKKSSTNK